MALNPKTYLTLSRIRLASATLANIPQALRLDLRLIENTLNQLIDAATYASDAAPLNPRIGTERLAIPPSWDPLGIGGTDPYYVVWDGSAWAAP
jgi:hypothetical protein